MAMCEVIWGEGAILRLGQGTQGEARKRSPRCSALFPHLENRGHGPCPWFPVPQAADALRLCGSLTSLPPRPEASSPSIQYRAPYFGIFQVDVGPKGPLWLHILKTSCVWAHYARPPAVPWPWDQALLQHWAVLPGDGRHGRTEAFGDP